jgi:hypothetical protein
MEAAMKRDLAELLDQVPVLVRAYGKCPSYVYLLLFTPFGRGLLGFDAAVLM